MKRYYSQITFFIIIVVLTTVSFLTYRNLSNYTDEVNWVKHSNRILRTLEMTLTALTDAETGHRGYQLSRDTIFLTPYYSATETIPPLLRTLDSLVSSDADQAKKVDSLKNMASYQFLLISRIIANADRSGLYMDTYEKNLLHEEKTNMDVIRHLVKDIRQTESQILTKRTSKENDFRSIAPVAIFSYTLVAIGGAIILFYRILEALRRRERAERELAKTVTLIKERELLLRQAEILANAGSWKWTAHDNTMVWSEGLIRILGNPIEKKRSWNTFIEFAHIDDRAAIHKLIADAIDSRDKGFQMECRCILNNSVRNFFLSVTAETEVEKGNLLGVMVDITDLKLKEKQLEQSNNDLTRSNEDLEQFAYVASHDLQEPLRKIRAFGDLLYSKYAPQVGDTGADYINRMQGAAYRMQILIEDLLSFSRVSRNSLNNQVVDTNLLVKEVLEDLDNQIQRDGASIEASELPAIEGDKIQLKRLFQNLVSNAVKFHQADKKPVIRIDAVPLTMEKRTHYFPAANPHVKYSMFTIEDNGIGFDQQYTEKIFNIFQRLNGRLDYEGTGIGLAICRKIVANHQGAITAESKEGSGSTFIIILPEIKRPP